MKITKEYRDDHQMKVVAEYDAETFERFKHRAAREISKKSKITGFRPGKAPYDIVLRNYGEEAIVEQAVDLLLDSEYANILKEAEVTPGAQGSLESIDTLTPPTFTFVIPLEPEINLGDYKALRKEYKFDEVTEEDVDGMVTRFRKNAATIVPVETPAEEENLLYLSVSSKFSKPVDGEPEFIEENKPQQVLIHKADEELDAEKPFKGFARKLIGLSASDKKEIKHKFPKDYDDETLAGKEVIYAVEVQSVKKLELPELNLEFIQTLGEFESVEEFRKGLHARMTAERKDNYDNQFFKELTDEIRNISTIKYPPQILEQEIEHEMEHLEEYLKKSNMSLETYLKIRDIEKDKMIEEEIKPNVVERLERRLVLEKIADVENIEADQERFKETYFEVINDLFEQGVITNPEKDLKNAKISRALSLETFTRLINTQIRERLKAIATGETEAETEKAPSEEPSPEVEEKPKAKKKAKKVKDPSAETSEGNEEKEQE